MAHNTLMGMYFEEFEVGQAFTSRGRTITETDIINFAGLSGDYNPMHTDAEYARQTPFGERVAHGVLGLAVATGLAYSMGFLEGTVIAFTGIDWKFRAPILIGDTIKVQAKITGKKAARSAGGGFITLELKLLNQRNETTQKGTFTVLVASQPGVLSDSATADESEAEGENIPL